jgi:hypothetical protein
MVSSCHIRYVDDPAEWDQLVLASGGRLLQSWRWGEFKQRHGWYCLRLSITAADGVALAQILVRRILPFSILYIPRGPLVREFTEALPRAFHHVIQQLARQYRAVAVLAEPEDASGLTVLPRELGWKPSRFVIQPRRTLKVPLGDDTMLLEQMKPKTRYNVRLAFRRGVTTRIASHSEVERFYELLRETAERDRFGIHQIDYFRDLLTLFGEDAALLFAEFAGSSQQERSLCDTVTKQSISMVHRRPRCNDICQRTLSSGLLSSGHGHMAAAGTICGGFLTPTIPLLKPTMSTSMSAAGCGVCIGSRADSVDARILTLVCKSWSAHRSSWRFGADCVR